MRSGIVRPKSGTPVLREETVLREEQVAPLRVTQCLALSKGDMDTLQRVFDELCLELGWVRDGERARRHARMLIDDYLAGNTNEKRLLIAGRAFAERLRREASS